MQQGRKVASAAPCFLHKDRRKNAYPKGNPGPHLISPFLHDGQKEGPGSPSGKRAEREGVSSGQVAATAATAFARRALLFPRMSAQGTPAWSTMSRYCR